MVNWPKNSSNTVATGDSEVVEQLSEFLTSSVVELIGSSVVR